MGTVYGRKNQNGTITYRAEIRRKGLKRVIVSFGSKEEAKAFLEAHEESYVLSGAPIEVDFLWARRLREFDRKRNKKKEAM